MTFTGDSFQHYLLGLFAVANNIPAIPLYLTIIHGLEKKEQHKLCNIATLTAFLTMMVTLFTGVAVLRFFEIGIPAFRIAGGLLLLSTGFSMMNSDRKPPQPSGSNFSNIITTAIIPIAIPLTTGAGTMSTIILFSSTTHNAPYMKVALLVAILVMTFIIWLSFRYAPKIVKMLGSTGLDVLTKIFGLITLAIGIQFILTGISDTFPKLV